jgi:glycosyltransferase involved in cell wall biosynthesis
MIVRNETDRHLDRCLESVGAILAATGGVLIATDDASTDRTIDALAHVDRVQLQFTPEPLFWEHEGRARQRHQLWIDQHASPGDWILCLDGDETVNKPELVLSVAQRAQELHKVCVGLPLYEFWSETHYRTDGFWFGTKATRLYAWREGGKIADKAMGCGSEPTYVRSEALTGGPYHQHALHLLHWGYLREQDRIIKHERYSERLGGHGHNNVHVESIVKRPTLERYDSE